MTIIILLSEKEEEEEEEIYGRRVMETMILGKSAIFTYCYDDFFMYPNYDCLRVEVTRLQTTVMSDATNEITIMLDGVLSS